VRPCLAGLWPAAEPPPARGTCERLIISDGLDSGRQDVAYEDFKGRKLDHRLLDLLKEF
jgi:hypothetical protein